VRPYVPYVPCVPYILALICGVVTFGCGDDAPSEAHRTDRARASTSTSSTPGTATAATPAEAEELEASEASDPDEVTAASEMHHAPPEDPAAPETDPDMLADSTDEFGVAALVAAHRARMRRERRAEVHVLRTRDGEAAGRRLCEEVVPRRPAATPVLIKPNLAGINLLRPHRIDDGIQLRTTGIEFLRGVVRCLKARGHREISIVEVWSRPEQLEDWQRATGLDRLLEEEDVKYYGLYDDRGPDGDLAPTFAAPNADAVRLQSGLRLPRVVARHLRDGLFISVPRLKMHRFAVMTLAIKNNMGLVVLEGAEAPRSGAGRMHSELGAWLHRFRNQHDDDRAAYTAALEAFAERIVDVLEIALPDATLIDGVPPVAGDGFALIEPLDDGVAIGSTNPVFAEAVAIEYMGYLDNADLAREIGHASPPLVEEAARRFWQTTDVLRDITIVGDDSFRSRERGRQVAHYRGMPGFEIGRRPSPMGALPWVENAMTARRGAEAPTIDGALDEAAWSQAEVMPIDTDWRGREAGPETLGRALWTPEALYFAFDCAYESLNVDADAPLEMEHPNLYRFDAVEVFLDHSPRSRGTYREYEFGPRGHFMDIDIDRSRRPRGDVEWSSEMTVGTRVDEEARRFTIEVRIPAAAVGRETLGPSQLKLALYRIAGPSGDRTHLARFPTYTERPNFHVPARFGWLRLIRRE